jgi:hypothetical protein
MGTILFTHDGQGLYGHEGYLAHVLDDGSSAGGTWTAEIEKRTIGWRAECECGWHGETVDSGGPRSPGTDAEEEAVTAVWYEQHGRPLLAALEKTGRLPELADAAAAASEALREGVRAARGQSATWEEIGRALGVTKQAAWERFG